MSMARQRRTKPATDDSVQNEKPNAQEVNDSPDSGGEALEFEAAPKVARALRLRRLGYTYDQIAKKVGYQTEAGARLAIKKANAKIVRDEATALAGYQLDMLDTALSVVMSRIAKDDKGSLWAVDRLTPLLKRQAELMALDQPKVDVDALALQNVRRVYERR